MSLNETDRRRPARGLLARTGVAVALVAVAVVAAMLLGRGSSESSAPLPASAAGAEGGAISPALKAKLASSARFAPGTTQYEAGEAGESEGVGDGAQDWNMHSAPGTDIPLAAIQQSRED